MKSITNQETLICNPGTVKDTRDTCLPKAMIHRLVKEWNSRHPEKKVESTESKREMWVNLRRNMQECETEYCAMKKLVPVASGHIMRVKIKTDSNMLSASLLHFLNVQFTHFINNTGSP